MVLTSIRNAVEELIAEQGSDAVTIPMVAERAGVNHSSIYRRWGDARTMINDLATYRLDPDRPLSDTGDVRADLAAWAQELLDHYGLPVNAALLRAPSCAAGPPRPGRASRTACATAGPRRPPSPPGLVPDSAATTSSTRWSPRSSTG